VAELRSFLVGVVIAGVVLLLAGIAFGLFGGDSNGSPSVRLLGTPPATRTPAPPATRNPSEFTPVVPVDTVAPAGGGTPAAGQTPAGGETPNPIQTATATLEVAPTAAATTAPAVNEVQVYVDTANQYTPALVAQLTYLAGNASAPNLASTDWVNFTLESAQSVQTLASAVAGISAPACLSSPHSALVAAANQASGAAGQVIAAVTATDANGVSASAGAVTSARDAVDSAVSTISAAIPACR
jgi:hypothetical protein